MIPQLYEALFTLDVFPEKFPKKFGRSIHTSKATPGKFLGSTCSLFPGNNYPCSGVGLSQLTPGLTVFPGK